MKQEKLLLAKRLKELRKDANITQKQLAAATNISYSSINSYESGRREPNSKAMAALERYFGVSGDYLRGNLEAESSYEYSAKIQNTLDCSIDLMSSFLEAMHYSSQTKQASAAVYFNNTLLNCIQKILPDDAEEIDSEQLNELIHGYFSLNQSGKCELLKRVDELLQLKPYYK